MDNNFLDMDLLEKLHDVFLRFKNNEVTGEYVINFLMGVLTLSEEELTNQLGDPKEFWRIVQIDASTNVKVALLKKVDNNHITLSTENLWFLYWLLKFERNPYFLLLAVNTLQYQRVLSDNFNTGIKIHKELLDMCKNHWCGLVRFAVNPDKKEKEVVDFYRITGDLYDKWVDYYYQMLETDSPADAFLNAIKTFEDSGSISYIFSRIRHIPSDVALKFLLDVGIPDSYKQIFLRHYEFLSLKTINTLLNLDDAPQWIKDSMPYQRNPYIVFDEYGFMSLMDSMLASVSNAASLLRAYHNYIAVLNVYFTDKVNTLCNLRDSFRELIEKNSSNCQEYLCTYPTYELRNMSYNIFGNDEELPQLLSIKA